LFVELLGDGRVVHRGRGAMILRRVLVRLASTVAGAQRRLLVHGCRAPVR
jgi:hypothetical protein